MTGIAGQLFGGTGRGSGLSVTANSVTRTETGVTSSGFVETVQLPNTQISGGVPPYTQLWTYESGSLVPAINDATLLNPTWSGVVESFQEIAEWKVTVTDSAANTASAVIQVSLNWISTL